MSDHHSGGGILDARPGPDRCTCDVHPDQECMVHCTECATCGAFVVEGGAALCKNCGPDAAPDQRTTGLYGKFHVSRNDGRDQPGGDRHGADYFVLDLTHDKHTPAALEAYALSVASEYPQLAADLFAKLGHRGRAAEMRERERAIEESDAAAQMTADHGRELSDLRKRLAEVTAERDALAAPLGKVPTVTLHQAIRHLTRLANLPRPTTAQIQAGEVKLWPAVDALMQQAAAGPQLSDAPLPEGREGQSIIVDGIWDEPQVMQWRALEDGWVASERGRWALPGAGDADGENGCRWAWVTR